jgi:hypothetical protein
MANIKTTSTEKFIYHSSGPNLNSESQNMRIMQIIFALFSIILVILTVLSLAINL